MKELHEILASIILTMMPLPVVFRPEVTGHLRIMGIKPIKMHSLCFMLKQHKRGHLRNSSFNNTISLLENLASKKT